MMLRLAALVPLLVGAAPQAVPRPVEGPPQAVPRPVGAADSVPRNQPDLVIHDVTS